MLSQGFAVLVAAALLSWRARVRGTGGLRSMAVAAVIAVLTFVSLSAAWSTWKGFRDERRGNASIAAADAATRGGAGAGANTGFVEWLNWKLPPGVRYYLRTDGSDEGTYQWATYRLHPRVAISDADEAHWLVFLKVTPAAAGFKRADFARVERYAPDLVLAERR